MAIRTLAQQIYAAQNVSPEVAYMRAMEFYRHRPNNDTLIEYGVFPGLEQS